MQGCRISRLLHARARSTRIFANILSHFLLCFFTLFFLIIYIPYIYFFFGYAFCAKVACFCCGKCYSDKSYVAEHKFPKSSLHAFLSPLPSSSLALNKTSSTRSKNIVNCFSLAHTTEKVPLPVCVCALLFLLNFSGTCHLVFSLSLSALSFLSPMLAMCSTSKAAWHRKLFLFRCCFIGQGHTFFLCRTPCTQCPLLPSIEY